jgi:ketosteroid isomerase-like protein
MSAKVPQVVATYIEATNSRDTDLLLTTLTPDAIITDEGHDYRGGEEIRAWKSKSNAQGQFTVEVLDVAETSRETIATAQVSGDFSGSPATLHFHFALRDNKISAVLIEIRASAPKDA